MQKIHYTGDCWDGQAVYPALWDLLLQKGLLLELAAGEPPYPVVLGVPHHAAPGVERIAGEWVNPRTGQRGRPADETAGLIGLAVLAALREAVIPARLVIAAHPADHDPNKTPGSPYWESIFSPPLPALLLELHGVGKSRSHDLELSAGRNRRTDPLSFGTRLAAHLPGGWKLAVQSRPGTSAGYLLQTASPLDQPADRWKPVRLEFPALSTPSLSFAGELHVLALHLEMKPFLRQPDPSFPGSPRPAPGAWRLARALASSIHDLMQAA